MPKYDHFRSHHRPYSDRMVNKRELKQRFLIVCEGEATEPNYFRSFRVPKEVAEIDVHGLGYNTVSLVREAMRLRDRGDYDQVWCVFDRDSFSVGDFNNAISLAKRNRIKIAYSNEAFELWYVLHFDFLNTGIRRHQYVDILERRMGSKYQKNSRDMYDLLQSRQVTALNHATRLLKMYKPRRPAVDNPSTTVHLLVVELNRFGS